MSLAQKTQGIKLEIGTQVVDPVGDTFAQFKGPLTFGGLGGESPIIDATELESVAREKLKGIPDSGDLEVGAHRSLGVTADAGQEAMKAAHENTGAPDSDVPYNFQITFNDAGSGAGATGTIMAFKALVTQFRTRPGEVDGKVELAVTLAITGTITETAATAGT